MHLSHARTTVNSPDGQSIARAIQSRLPAQDAALSICADPPYSRLWSVGVSVLVDK